MDRQGVRERKAPDTRLYRSVAADVLQLWNGEGIPTYDLYYVSKRIKAECYDAVKNVNKQPKKDRQSESSVADHFLKLFDIARCKCPSQTSCQCPLENKVPTEEWEFLNDQRRQREMRLGPVDRATTAARNIRLERREARQIRQPEPDAGPGDFVALSTSSEEEPRPRRTESDDTDYVPPPDATAPASDVNDDDLSHTALAVDRCGVSNRAAAAIINAFQTDIGRVSAENDSHVVDPMKMWRARDRVRKETARSSAEEVQATGVTALYFDGRKDKTCTDHTSATEVEEHVVVLAEPGSKYLTHFTPQSGKAIDLLNELYSTSLQFGCNVKALGCDGTAVNTGAAGGVCRLFELVTEAPVQWFICQLHANELNLRHVLLSLDGTTSGRRSFAGPIGKECATDVWERPPVTFEAVPGIVEEIADVVVAQLSHDQQRLYLLSRAVQDGIASTQTAGARTGALNHAR